MSIRIGTVQHKVCHVCGAAGEWPGIAAPCPACREERRAVA